MFLQEREPMTQVQLAQVIEEIKTLSPAPAAGSCGPGGDVPTPADAPMTEDEFVCKLVQFGVLSEVKPPITDLAPYQNRQPVDTTSKPLSRSSWRSVARWPPTSSDSSAVVKRYVRETGSSLGAQHHGPYGWSFHLCRSYYGCRSRVDAHGQARHGALAPTMRLRRSCNFATTSLTSTTQSTSPPR